ncbi:MAG TPA: outer membrane protein transport protein [Thermoanaerobaculia bacterium]|nr:outer membrane protein transport protein [Thermoanaerobaculia bacterium]
MRLKGCTLLAAALVLATAPAQAGNGHVLHGTGAINSSMGGAGVALPNDVLGALNLNPALLTRLDGHRFEFSVEYNTPGNAVESRVGPFAGRTEEDGDPSLIPAFGWTRHKEGTRLAYGMGVLGLAGFGADYPQDPRNPLLAPQPQGFGRIYSNYQLMKVPTVLAWQLGDQLSLGVSLNAARSALTASPAGFASPDCSGPAGPCFFPSVNADSAWGFGATLGALYEVTPVVALGLSYSTETDFEDFEWNSTVANPNRPNFGAGRRITLQLNYPAVLVAGLGITPGDRLAIALDGKWIDYEETEGFADVLGFENITVIALGVQFRATDRLTLRAGYNVSDNPIPEERTFFTVATPAIFEDRVTAGLGLQATESLQVNLGYYHVFENEISGPFVSPAGPVPGTQVTTEMSMDSVLASFSFRL